MINKDETRTAIVVRSQKKVLVLKQTYRETEFWSLPGGRSTADESPERTAIRKLREEIGVAIKESHLNFDMTYKNTNFFEVQDRGQEIFNKVQEDFFLLQW